MSKVKETTTIINVDKISNRQVQKLKAIAKGYVFQFKASKDKHYLINARKCFDLAAEIDKNQNFLSMLLETPCF